MKLNKMLWIFALVLLVAIPSAFAAPAIFRNMWFMLAVNSLIVWFILFALQSMIVPEKLAKEKTVLFIITLVASLLISWRIVGGGGYIWEVGHLAAFFSFKLIVNTIIISLVVYFGLGLLGVKPGTKEGQIGIALLAIGVGLLIAFNISNEKWLWDTDNIKVGIDYLFGPEKDVEYKVKIPKKEKVGGILGFGGKEVDVTEEKVTKQRVGGILRPEEPNYRLLIFITSALLFVWFFTGFLMPQSNIKLSVAMAIILAANLARTGTPTTSVIALGEAFAILLVGKQITAGGGLLGNWIGWIVTIGLVEWIFHTVFGGSQLAGVLAKMFGGIPIIGPILSKLADIFPAAGTTLSAPGSILAAPATAVSSGGKSLGGYLIELLTGYAPGQWLTGMLVFGLASILLIWFAIKKWRP